MHDACGYFLFLEGIGFAIPIARVNAPTVKDASWVRNPMDAFVLARLKVKGLKPSAEADQRTDSAGGDCDRCYWIAGPSLPSQPACAAVRRPL